MRIRTANKQKITNKYLLAGATVAAVAVLARPLFEAKVYAVNQYTWTKQEDIDLLGGKYTSSAVSANGNHLILSTMEGGENTDQTSPLFISQDYGTTWENVADEVDEGVRNWWTSVDVSNNGQVMVAASDWGIEIGTGATDGKIFISENGGSTWADISPVDTDNWEQIVVSGDGSKIAAIENGVGEIHVTENGGDSWTTVDIADDVWNLKSIAISDDGDKMLVGGENQDYETKEFITSNNGTDWTDVSPNPSGGVYWSRAAMSATGDKIAVATVGWEDGSVGNVFVSENNGADWTDVTPDMSSPDLTSIAMSDDGSSLAVLHESDGMFQSSNLGDSWTLEDPSLEYEDSNNWLSLDINQDGAKAVVTGDYNAYLLGEASEETPSEPTTVSFNDPESSKTVTLTTPAGTTITCHSAVKEASLSTQDAGYMYPLGLVDFCFSTEDESNEVTIVFTTDLKPNEVVARKYNPTTQRYDTVSDVSITETTQGGQHALRVTYTIVDNGPLDLDPDEGEIADPIGLANAVGTPNTGQKPFWLLDTKR